MNRIARKGKPMHRIPFYAPMQGYVIEHNIHRGQRIEAEEKTVQLRPECSEHNAGRQLSHMLRYTRLISLEFNVKCFGLFSGREGSRGTCTNYWSYDRGDVTAGYR